MLELDDRGFVLTGRDVARDVPVIAPAAARPRAAAARDQPARGVRRRRRPQRLDQAGRLGRRRGLDGRSGSSGSTSPASTNSSTGPRRLVQAKNGVKERSNGLPPARAARRSEIGWRAWRSHRPGDVPSQDGGAGPIGSPAPSGGQAVLTSMRWRCACSAFGMRMLRTPSLSLASIFLGSTWVGNVTR